MIVSKITSGLGNQMFQYAFGRMYSLERNTELKLDLRVYKSKRYTSYKHHNRVFKLDCFNVKYSEANIWDFFRFESSLFKKFKKIKEELLTFDPEMLSHSEKHLLFECFWQTEKYFKEFEMQIRNDFKFLKDIGEQYKALELDICKHKNAVSVHVRRGDYVENKEIYERHGVCELDYYQKAFDYLNRKFKDTKYYIFSNDLKWCKENFPSLINDFSFVEVQNYSDIDEMNLMSKCKHNIIANSSFSWWGAWLNNNTDKIVIAPERWYKAEYLDGSDIVPDSWIKL